MRTLNSDPCAWAGTADEIRKVVATIVGGTVEYSVDRDAGGGSGD